MVNTRSKTPPSYIGKIPDFFKVYIPQSSSHVMRIPPAVAVHLKNDICFYTIIRNLGNNKLWQVRVRKAGDYIAFEQGWPAFVKDNSLRYGYFLIFSYNETSEFHVTVYGENQCNMEYPVEHLTSGSDEVMPQGNDDQDSKSKSPFFEVVVKPTHTAYGPLAIPVSFVRKFMQKVEPTSCLLKCANKTYTVKVNYVNKIFSMNSGYYKFAQDNSLKTGQICRFELISSHGYTFQVSVRAADSIHPNFRMRLGEYHFKKFFMFIPTKFVRMYMDRSIETAKLEYSSKQWQVKVTGERLSFGSGLDEFLMNNNLQIGNTCLFELIEKEDEYVFKVSLCT